MAGRLVAGAVLFVAATLATPVAQTQYNTATIATTGSASSPSSTGEVDQPSPSPSPYGGSSGHHYHSPAWISEGSDLKSSLSQSVTNGKSVLGLLSAPKLPKFLTGGPLPQGFPWGGRTATNTNQYTNTPNTGVTRYYDFTISYQTIAPDGVERQGLVINGAFPGPTIEANWGDWIQVTVTNALPDEGTSLHWHGLLQVSR